MRSRWTPEATLEPGPFPDKRGMVLRVDFGSILGSVLELKIHVFRYTFFDKMYDALWYRFWSVLDTILELFSGSKGE